MACVSAVLDTQKASLPEAEEVQRGNGSMKKLRADFSQEKKALVKSRAANM